MSTHHIFLTTGLSDLPILTTTKFSPSHTTKTTAVVSSPDPGVTIITGTDAARYVFLAPGLHTLHFFVLVLRGCGDEDVGWVEQDQM